jgi:hypothetical protein
MTELLEELKALPPCPPTTPRPQQAKPAAPPQAPLLFPGHRRYVYRSSDTNAPSPRSLPGTQPVGYDLPASLFPNVPGSLPGSLPRPQPRLEFGFQFGVFNPFGDISLSGFDSLAANPLDRRFSSGSSARVAIGAELTLFPLPAFEFPCFTGMSQGTFFAEPFVRSGFFFLPGPNDRFDFAAVNAFPRGTGTFTQTVNWGVPILGGMRLTSPAFTSANVAIGLDLAGGVLITDRTTRINIFEIGAGRIGGFGSWSTTVADPMFSVGAPISSRWGGFALTLRPEIGVIFPTSNRSFVQSLNFISQSYTFETSAEPTVFGKLSLTTAINFGDILP